MKTKKEQRAAFMRLAEIEPGLADLLSEIERLRKETKGKLRFCANAYWYGAGSLRRRVSGLAGWHAASPKLRNCASYDIAFSYLWRLLPDCRNCGCPGIEVNEDELELELIRARELGCNP